ncbi:MAG TPA: response regulator [Caulobacteraceae bacterium]|nr:response regulator [Caulobacteraceae bacterium]
MNASVRNGGALRVLVVEDEAMVSMLLEDFLEDIGCTVVGPAFNLEEASTLAAAGDFDVAILDVNLGGERTFSVADRLDRDGKPFAFATGYGAAGLRDEDEGRPVLQKPFTLDDLKKVVEGLSEDAQAPAMKS